MDSAEMAEIRRQKIADATQVLHAAYVGRMDEAYLEFDINNRLAKIEAAIESGDSLSEESQVMTETLELGRTCTFGGE
ncbi:MAG: hypothetical protein NXH78_13320 [Hyphomonadaceae bacterium]|nr:hypothetical protein [Hyphomonadaceae bacterium]